MANIETIKCYETMDELLGQATGAIILKFICAPGGVNLQYFEANRLKKIEIYQDGIAKYHGLFVPV